MKKYSYAIALGIAGAMLTAAAASPVFAEANVNVDVTATLGATTSVSGTANASAGVGLRADLKNGKGLGTIMATITTRANQEIARRLTALNSLMTRINGLTQLSADEKASLTAAIQAQITAMNTLKAKIRTDGDTEITSSLRSDVQSITASYRIFALVIPQGAIEAAADRIGNIVTSMNDLSAKFSSRISAAASAGNNVSAAQSSLTDFNAKIADASGQAKAANQEVASLTPDNGNTSTMQSNTAALKDARVKIMAAQKDLMAARADAMAIIKAFGKFKVSVSATTTASATAQ